MGRPAPPRARTAGAAPRTARRGRAGAPALPLARLRPASGRRFCASGLAALGGRATARRAFCCAPLLTTRCRAAHACPANDPSRRAPFPGARLTLAGAAQSAQPCLFLPRPFPRPSRRLAARRGAPARLPRATPSGRPALRFQLPAAAGSCVLLRTALGPSTSVGKRTQPKPPV
ncbi:MAG: hypothetical protein J3K34DRAFT_414468 [Monoraphidium minutum]|nr:MAG: hypothetical protein J3K34DRAFT_414468 [Monoraphidium minutum]